MSGETPGKAHAPAQALTQRDYIQACIQSGPRPWVQMMRRQRGEGFVLCGQIAELNINAGEWFKVDTAQGVCWARGHDLRLCSGDGRCTCEADTNARPPC
jgi:hypothetical protein